MIKKLTLIFLALIVAATIYEPTNKKIFQSLAKAIFPISGCPDSKFGNTGDKFFSQFYEDYILSNIFDEVDKGFYVDVGANNPNHLNATLYFHKKGWKGMNFEPQPGFHEIFLKDRSEDINIQKAVADKIGTATFYVPSALSPIATLDSKIKDTSHAATTKEIIVEVTTLTKEFTDHNIHDIDFLKIDVEGFEDKVIAGLDLQKFRPKVIVLEYISPTQKQGYLLFEPKLLENNYILGADDWLNRYYYRKENPELGKKFKAIGRCVTLDILARSE